MAEETSAPDADKPPTATGAESAAPATDDKEEPAPSFWTPLYTLVLAVLGLVALTQAFFLVRSLRQPTVPPTLPVVEASPQASMPSVAGNPGPGPGPGPGPSGMPGGSSLQAGSTLIVPPHVLFRALVSLQKDPKTKLTGASLDKMKELLEQWIELDKNIKSKVMPRIAACIAGLSEPQRDLITKQASSSLVKRGPPELEQLIAVLNERAGNAKPMAVKDAVPADKQFFKRVPPQTLITALLKLDADPKVALTPEQAAALLPAVNEWKRSFDEYLQLMGSMTALLNEQQRTAVQQVQAQMESDVGDRVTSVEEARDALGG